jgi:hypothetical protein
MLQRAPFEFNSDIQIHVFFCLYLIPERQHAIQYNYTLTIKLIQV